MPKGSVGLGSTRRMCKVRKKRQPPPLKTELELLELGKGAFTKKSAYLQSRFLATKAPDLWLEEFLDQGLSVELLGI